MAGRVDTCGMTDIGLVRERNEDHFLIADLKKSVVIHHTSLSYDDETHLMGGSQAKLFLVADGVSDDLIGERASRLAIQGIVQYLLNTMHWLFRVNDGREDAFLEDLKSALAFTQEKIREIGTTTSSRSPIGTMTTLAYVVWPQVYLIHIGNTRAYVFRDRRIVRLTHDQTNAQALVDAGLMDAGQIRDLPVRPILSGLKGRHPHHLIPEVTQFKLSLHDKLLLCTDGLTTQLSDAEITELLSTDVSAEETCGLLINAANVAGGQDNTTVVLAHFTDGTTAQLKRKVEIVNSQKQQSADSLSGSEVSLCWPTGEGD